MDARACNLVDLVERYYALLYRYAYRLTGSSADAEDLTQQAFLTAQTHWNQLRDEGCAKSWLFAITRNAYLKELRGQSRVRTTSLDGLAAEPNADLFEDDIDAELLQRLLDELPEEFRTPLILYYFDEFSYKEIAAQMGAPLGTVMSRLSRAKAWLRGRLAPSEPSVLSAAAKEPLA